jgi:hypothetical protein
MPVSPSDDIIYGGTPLEVAYAGIHPRLHFSQGDLEALRPRLAEDPWKTWLDEVRACADESLLPQAFVFALTRDPVWLERATRTIRAYLRKFPSAFCSAYYLACAYDWLYHDLSPALRRRIQVLLDTRLRPEYEAFAKHELYAAGPVCWNISSEEFGNIAAAGFALYGEVPRMAPWIRFVTEKIRVTTQALGPDGVSAEGICYGGFFTETYVKTLDLVNRLMGVDLFEGNAYLQNLPWIYLFSAIPRKRMTHNNSVLCLGDGATGHWCGPASYLHKIAARYRDPMAQAIVSRHRAAGASAKGSSLYSLLWYDASVPDRMPAGLPRSRHFQDKDIVAMRSDWKGDESVLLFKCGPHAGHKALRDYPQCLSGGHMAADAGSILFYAHGERLISDGGYAKKYTSYRNTVLVNGIGQTGECGEANGSDWFECCDLRRDKRGPSLLRVDLGKDVDYMIGNVAPAYQPEAGLTRFLRHLIYLRPDTVVIVDELAADKPSTFELWFHADTQPHAKPERPFLPVAAQAWESAAPKGRCRITSLIPARVDAETGIQLVEGIGAHVNRDVDVLRLRNSRPQASAVFVTVLDAFAPGTQRPLPEVVRQGKTFALKLSTPGLHWTLRIQPGRKNPADSIIVERTSSVSS